MFYLGSQMTFIEVPLGLMELPLIAGDIPQLVPLAVLCDIKIVNDDYSFCQCVRRISC